MKTSHDMQKGAQAPYDYLLKTLIIGDSDVGKSQLISQYCDQGLTRNPSTIGVEFAVNTVEHQDKTIKLQIWDTAGQERFRAITSSYYRGAKIFILVFDVTNAKSFENIKRWINEVENHADDDRIMLLVGTNSHKRHEYIVDEATVHEFATENGMKYFPVSVEKNINVDAVFSSAVTAFFDKHPELINQPPVQQNAPVDTDALATEIHQLRNRLADLAEQLQEKEVLYYETSGKKLSDEKPAKASNASKMSLGFGARSNKNIGEDNEMRVLSNSTTVARPTSPK